MRIRTKLLLYFFILFSLNLLHAKEAINTSEVPKIRFYRTHKYDTLDSIALEFLLTNGKKHGDDINGYMRELKQLNTQVKDWNNLPPKTLIFLDALRPSTPKTPVSTEPVQSEIAVPKEVEPVKIVEPIKLDEPAKAIDPIKPAEPVKVIEPVKPVDAPKVIEPEKVKTPEPTPAPQNTACDKPRLTTLITFSQGQFNEKSKDGQNTWQNTENSPITLGFAYNHFINNCEIGLSASAYYSYLAPSHLEGDVAGTPSLVQPNPEVGATLYVFKNIFHSLFVTGIDYEKMSTINTARFAAGADIALYSNTLMFATFGIGKTYSFFEHDYSFKINYSKTISSKTNGPSTDNFAGSKILVFAQMHGDHRFSYHLFYKRHWLKGPTVLTISRIGIGLGYALF